MSSLRKRKGIASGDVTARRVAFILMAALMFTMLAATVVEASAMDNVRTAWGSIRVYMLSGAFWVNSLLMFAVIFILYSVLLAEKLGRGYGNTQQIMMYIVIGIIALVIAARFVGADGRPQYVWRNEQFRQFTQFLIGPADAQPACVAPRSWWSSEVPCCGSGTYFVTINGEQRCKQAILRTNTDGSGLPAFIVATILFYLLFAAFKKNLGIDSLGNSGSAWFPIILALILGAMMANERVTKSTVLIIGGWVALILLGNRLSKTLGGESKDGAGNRRGFGFGLAYAFIQLILNMLGTSLWGGTVEAGSVGTTRIIFNILIGLVIGVIYGAFVGEGVFGEMMKQMKEKQKKDVEALIKNGKLLKPFLRSLPFTGKLKWLKPDKSKKKQMSEKLNKKLEAVRNDYVTEMTKDPPDKDRIEALATRIDDTMRAIEDIKNMPDE